MRVLLERSAPALIGILFLAAWEAAVRYWQVPPYVLPGPLRIAATLWTDGPSLFGSLLVTLRITAAALAAAALLGGGLALLFARSRVLEASLFPYAVALQVTPIVANTTTGLNSADRNLVELFRLYGASPWQTLRLLRLPSALPYFLAGLRISGGLALIGAVVAEFVAGTGGAETGLAFRILESGYRLQIPRLFAALVMLSVTGILIYAALAALSRFLLRRWHDSALPGDQ